jgi:hypothetical protein
MSKKEWDDQVQLILKCLSGIDFKGLQDWVDVVLSDLETRTPDHDTNSNSVILTHNHPSLLQFSRTRLRSLMDEFSSKNSVSNDM